MNKLLDPNYQFDQFETASLDLNDLMARLSATTTTSVELSAIDRIKDHLAADSFTGLDRVPEQFARLNAGIDGLEPEIQALKASK